MPPMSSGGGVDADIDFAFLRMVETPLAPKASPRRSKATSAVLSFFARAITSLPLTFVR